MKILHVINSLEIGDEEKLINDYLINSRCNKDIKNELCILYVNKSFLYSKLVKDDIKIYNLN